jgi:hypothetical protein
VRVYVSKEPISRFVYTRHHRLPKNIEVKPTYWVRENKKNAFVPLQYPVECVDIGILKYLWLLWRNRSVILDKTAPPPTHYKPSALEELILRNPNANFTVIKKP